ncbi:MAG: NRDE family protein [Balneola sp.]|nr:MAG: NRDE family protein [Balneola sp.]
MCLITFAYKVHSEYDLVLAANRDEFYGRPTRRAQFWQEENQENILAGKDLEAGGTWMGVEQTGKWAALTNYRDPSIERENPPSRGELVLNYLAEHRLPENYLRHISPGSSRYQGFNLLVGDAEGIFHFSNINQESTRIKPGFHGLSNALMDTPWPKLEQAKNDLAKAVSHDDIDYEQLFSLLKNDHRAPDEELPDTGIPKEWERAVSSVFIKTEQYGTRSSTLLLIDKKGQAEFIERRYDFTTSEVIEENTFKLVFG